MSYMDVIYNFSVRLFLTGQPSQQFIFSFGWIDSLNLMTLSFRALFLFSYYQGILYELILRQVLNLSTLSSQNWRTQSTWFYFLLDSWALFICWVKHTFLIWQKSLAKWHLPLLRSSSGCSHYFSSSVNCIEDQKKKKKKGILGFTAYRQEAWSLLHPWDALNSLPQGHQEHLF